MLYIMDTANLDKIRHCVEFYPFDHFQGTLGFSQAY